MCVCKIIIIKEKEPINESEVFHRDSKENNGIEQKGEKGGQKWI